MNSKMTIILQSPNICLFVFCFWSKNGASVLKNLTSVDVVQAGQSKQKKALTPNSKLSAFSKIINTTCFKQLEERKDW